MAQSLLQWLAEPFQYAFMVRALGVAALVGIVCAVLSCFVTLKGWSLMGDAISHSVLPGVILAYLVGLPFGIGAFVSGLASALLIGWVRANTRLRDDTVIGVVFTAFFGLGLVLSSKLPAMSEWVRVNFGYLPPMLNVREMLFGNVLGIADSDVIQTVLFGGITLVLVIALRRDLMLFCFDPNHARAIGLNTTALNYLLLSLLAMTIVSALQTLGIVLVVASLITPGAIAYLLTSRFSRMLLLAVSISVVACIGGVYLSYYAGAATGATIVFIQAVLFLGVLLVAPKRGVLAQYLQRRALQKASPSRELGAAPTPANYGEVR